MVIIDTIKGDLLNSKKSYICQQCNCHTIKAHGLSKYISDKYFWGDLYQTRPKKSANSTTHPDEPGTIIELEHPTDPSKFHTVLCFMAQWCPGKPKAYQRYSTTYDLPVLNSFKVTRPRLPITGKYTFKDQKKSDMANLFIGRGSITSSTNKYFNVWNKLGTANIGKYTSSDIVFISAEGSRKGRLSLDNNEVNKALDARAIIIADERKSRESSYNLGEREILNLLQSANYIEYPKESGHWFPPNYDDTYQNRKKWFQECLDILDENNYGTVAMPYGIGCGLAGGKWAEYKKMLEECQTKIVLYQLSTA